MSNLKNHIALILFLISSYSFSQDFKVSSNYIHGFIIPEFDLLDNINEGAYQGVEMSFFTSSKQKNYWQTLYNYPEYGVSVWYTNFGEPNVLGYSLGAEYFFKINFINKNKYKLYARSGFGINYISEKFDEVDNPLNTSMGSNINARFNLRLANSIYFTERLALNLGIGLDHFSNANTRYPNRGINAVAFYGGITYQFGKEQEYKAFEIPEYKNSFSSFVSLNTGFFQTKWPNNSYYLVPSLAYDVNYSLGKIFSLGIGADAFYNSSIKKRYGNIDGFKTANSMLLGVHFSQNIYYHKFTFSLQEGLYLYSYKELDKKPMYNRVQFKWQLSSKLSGNIHLQSYLNDLEFVGVGISYQLN